MGTIRYQDDVIHIDNTYAQMLALAAARLTASGQNFTVRVAGLNSREQWLTVTPGVHFRITCPPLPTGGDERRNLDDSVAEALDVAGDSGIIAVEVRR